MSRMYIPLANGLIYRVTQVDNRCVKRFLNPVRLGATWKVKYYPDGDGDDAHVW